VKLPGLAEIGSFALLFYEQICGTYRVSSMTVYSVSDFVQ